MLPLLLHAQQKFCAAIELTGERLILGEILQNTANDSVLTVKTLQDSIRHIEQNQILSIRSIRYKLDGGRIVPQIKNRGLALFLSGILPGGGQFYNGDYIKGVLQLGLSTASIAALATLPNTKPASNYQSLKDAMTFVAVYSGIRIWSIVDAWYSASSKNEQFNAKYKPYLKFSGPDLNLNIKQNSPCLGLAIIF